MKVLALIASPRKSGNSEMAAKEILSRFPEDWEKAMIRLNDLDLKLCKGCYACLPKGSPCRQDDDLQFVLDQIQSADRIVVTTPVYVLGGNGVLKVITDRLFSLISDHKDFKRKDCVLVSSYGLSTWQGIAKEFTQIFARKMYMNVLADAMLPANHPGEVLQGTNLERLHELADILLKGEKEAPVTVRNGLLECPVCTGTAFMLGPDGKVTCGVCGAEGKLAEVSGALAVDIAIDAIQRFDDEGSERHAKFIAGNAQRFKDTFAEIKAIQREYRKYDGWFIAPEKSE